MAYQRTEAHETQPGSSGGMIESVKMAVMTALKKELTGISFSDKDGNYVSVDLEYPLEVERYPMIWVQFSPSVLRPSGMGHVQDTSDGSIVEQWYYEGRVTLSVVALTSLERDRISDRILDMLSFPNYRSPVARRVEDDIDRTDLYQSLADNPYIGININSDVIRPGGQSTTVGVPWDPEQLSYEDAYSFDVLGDYQKVWDNTGYWKLRRIDVYPENVTARRQIEPGTWI